MGNSAGITHTAIFNFLNFCRESFTLQNNDRTYREQSVLQKETVLKNQALLCPKPAKNMVLTLHCKSEIIFKDLIFNLC